ncbi:MAG: hypothetical protein IT210_00645 [Armatimonadetes bacterium]|nr:hypothetical protein [Armatimonadota bacterium]
MGRMGALLIIIALALGAYNAWSIAQVQENLDNLRKQAHAARAAAPTSEEPPRMAQDLLVSAQKHSLRARELLRKGQVKQATEELNKSIQELKAASDMTRSRSASALKDLNKTVNSLKETAEGLWSRLGGSGQKPSGSAN